MLKLALAQKGNRRLSPPPFLCSAYRKAMNITRHILMVDGYVMAVAERNEKTGKVRRTFSGTWEDVGLVLQRLAQIEHGGNV